MGTSIMDNQGIPNTSLRQFTVLSKLVIVFTKRTCDINHLNITIWISHISNVVVGIVHCWAKQVNCRSINTNITSISILNMENLSNKESVWRCHETTKFSVNTDVPKIIWNKDFIKFSMNTFTDSSNIVLLVRWRVVYPNTT